MLKIRSSCICSTGDFKTHEELTAGMSATTYKTNNSKRIMEKFMLFFRGSDVYQPGQSPEALQTLKEKMIHWLTDLSEQGTHVASEPLETTGKQVFGSGKTVMDGPFGKSREIVGGCTIVQAKDLDAAIEIAKGCPILESNANIEVRPIQGM